MGWEDRFDEAMKEDSIDPTDAEAMRLLALYEYHEKGDRSSVAKMVQKREQFDKGEIGVAEFISPVTSKYGSPNTASLDDYLSISEISKEERHSIRISKKYFDYKQVLVHNPRNSRIGGYVFDVEILRDDEHDANIRALSLAVKDLGYAVLGIKTKEESRHNENKNDYDVVSINGAHSLVTIRGTYT